VAEVKSVPQNKNPSSCVLILVYLMTLFHLYRLVLHSVSLNGKTLIDVWVKKLKKAFVVRLTVDLNMSFATRDRENQDDPYDNIQS